MHEMDIATTGYILGGNDSPSITMPPFGSFSPFCSSPASGLDTSSPLPHCNLFFSALLHVSNPPALQRLFPRPIHVHGHRIINSPDAEDPANGQVMGSANRDDPLVRRYVARAGAGVGMSCDVGRAGVDGSFGDIGESLRGRCWMRWAEGTQHKSWRVVFVSCSCCFLSFGLFVAVRLLVVQRWRIFSL
jgi:hypothetical protein